MPALHTRRERLGRVHHTPPERPRSHPSMRSPHGSRRCSSTTLGLWVAAALVLVFMYMLTSVVVSKRKDADGIRLSFKHIPFFPAYRVDEERVRRSCGSGNSNSPRLRRVVVTGSAGFIGFHVANALVARGDGVVGVDNFNNYYPVSLKESREGRLDEIGVYTVRGDVRDADLMASLIHLCQATHVVHLAAQAGVRYAALAPMQYVDYNVAGTVGVFEAVKRSAPRPAVVYASSSSVYGRNTKVPFSELDRVDNPASLYAATKRAVELMAEVYHGLEGISMTGLRFFTVYGPWGRPDMAYMSFARAMVEGTPVRIFQVGHAVGDWLPAFCRC